MYKAVGLIPKTKREKNKLFDAHIYCLEHVDPTLSTTVTKECLELLFRSDLGQSQGPKHMLNLWTWESSSDYGGYHKTRTPGAPINLTIAEHGMKKLF